MPNQELSPQNFNVLPEDIARTEGLFRMVQKGIRDPRVTDPVEAAMLRGILPELFDGGYLREPVDWAFAFRRQRGSYYPPGYDLRTLEFGLDKQLRRGFPEDYPRFGSGRHFWEGKKVLSQIDQDELLWDMQQNLRSTITSGYEIFKVLSHLFKNRWPYPPTVVDTGTSLGLGLKKWKMHEELPFKPMRVLKAPKKGQPISPELAPDQEVQMQIDHLVNQKPVIGQTFGYDILPISSENKDAVDLTFSSTFPMFQSQVDPVGASEFNKLVGVSPPGVELLKSPLDATNPADLAELSQSLPGGKADIYIFSGVILQLPPEKLVSFFHNFAPHCNEGALFFVNEWANLNPNMPNGLEMIREDWWHKGQFKTFIMDPSNLDQPPLEFCHFLSRQAQQMYLTPDGEALLRKSSS